MYLGNCMPADWLGQVAKSAVVRKRGIDGTKPTEALVDGFFLRVSASSFLYDFSDSLWTNLHASFVHFFAPPPALVLSPPRLMKVAGLVDRACARVS